MNLKIMMLLQIIFVAKMISADDPLTLDVTLEGKLNEQYKPKSYNLYK
jgi:hypothetical protein